MVHIFLQLVANRISPKLADPITMLRSKSESDLMFNNHSTRHKQVRYKGMETMIAKGKGSTTYMLLLCY
jgi:hypothetical protein